MLNMVAKLCVLRERREHSATSSVYFVQVKLERIISGFQYVTDRNRRIESYVQLLQNAVSSVSDRMDILVLQYACTTVYGIFGRWKY